MLYFLWLLCFCWFFFFPFVFNFYCFRQKLTQFLQLASYFSSSFGFLSLLSVLFFLTVVIPVKLSASLFHRWTSCCKNADVVFEKFFTALQESFRSLVFILTLTVSLMGPQHFWPLRNALHWTQTFCAMTMRDKLRG